MRCGSRHPLNIEEPALIGQLYFRQMTLSINESGGPSGVRADFDKRSFEPTIGARGKGLMVPGNSRNISKPMHADQQQARKTSPLLGEESGHITQRSLQSIHRLNH